MGHLRRRPRGRMRSPWRWAAPLLALSLLAGCLGPPPSADPSPPARPAPPAPAGFTVANNATACSRVFVAMPVDPAHAQAMLPPGFEAADLRDFFHLDGPPAGKAVGLVSLAQCASAQWHGPGMQEAAVGILVRSPVADGAFPDNVYELARLLPGGPVRENLTRLGWPLEGDGVTVRYADSPAPSGSATAHREGGAAMEVQVPAAPAEDAFDVRIRWWRDLPTGRAWSEQEFRVDGRLGPGSCSFAPATAAMRLAGGSGCPPGTLFMVGPPFDIRGRFHFEPTALPGAIAP